MADVVRGDAGGAGVVGCVSARECVCVFPSPQGTATFRRLARNRPQANTVSYGGRVYFQNSAVQLSQISDEVITLSGKLELFLQDVPLFLFKFCVEIFLGYMHFG